MFLIETIQVMVPVGTSYGYVNLPIKLCNYFPIKQLPAYGENDYLIEAKKIPNVLTFRVTFNEDKGANPKL